jgi:hypothetical protein
LRDFGISACPKASAFTQFKRKKFARLGEMIQDEYKNCLEDCSRLKVSLLSDIERSTLFFTFSGRWEAGNESIAISKAP